MNLPRAVALLVDRPKLRIQSEADPQLGYTVEAPCLLQQLHDAFGASSGGHGGRTVPGSRMPLNTAALELWTEVTTSTAAWAEALDVDRARYRQRTSERQPPPVGLLLRAVAAAAAGREDRTELAARISHNCHRWARQIAAMLAPDPAAGRGLNGVECVGCRIAWVTEVPSLIDGETLWVRADSVPDQQRQPALWVEYGDTGVIRCLWCRACGAYTWRDELLQRAG